MELALIIWAVGAIPQIGIALAAVGSVGTVVSLFAKVVCSVNGIDRNNKEEHPSDFMVANLSHKALYWVAPIWILGLAIPNQETAYQMLAAYGVQSVVENKEAQELASDGVDVLKALMAKAKKELEEPAKD